MHSVRQSILEILKESGTATVADLAERLEMAPVSVRHHLDILQGDNLIRVGRVERLDDRVLLDIAVRNRRDVEPRLVRPA